MAAPSAEAASPRPDAWLSNVLGFPAFVASTPTLGVGLTPSRALFSARVPATNVAELEGFLALGFRVIDVNVTLARLGGDRQSNAFNALVKPATPSQAEPLLQIAASCFRYSRFHLDPSIPNELADRVKREWLRSYVEGRRGAELLAATIGTKTVGFLAVLEAADGAAVIDLVGVDLDAQRQGVGRNLVTAFVERHGSDGRELRVGTQVANVPSLRLYEEAGFRVSRRDMSSTDMSEPRHAYRRSEYG